MNGIDKTSDAGVKTLTLAQLLEIGGVKGSDLMHQCLAITDSVIHSNRTYQPAHLDAFLIGVGMDGEASFSYNLQECTLRRGSLFIFSPRNILQLHKAENFKAHLILIAPQMLHSINIEANRIMPTLLKFGPRPSIDIDSKQCETLGRYISLIGNEVMEERASFSHEIVSELITAFLYKTADILKHYMSAHPEVERVANSRAEVYFRQFMELLGQHYKEERGVAFYAQQLCITPKYLTTLVKRFSDKSVSEWIDTFVIVEAKTMLRYTNMSVQEIAYRLNFANQSFFGSYFKRITGMSPSQYKADER